MSLFSGVRYWIASMSMAWLAWHGFVFIKSLCFCEKKDVEKVALVGSGGQFLIAYNVFSLTVGEMYSLLWPKSV